MRLDTVDRLVGVVGVGVLVFRVGWFFGQKQGFITKN